MPMKRPTLMLFLAAALAGCVSMGRYRALEGQNAALQAQAAKVPGLQQSRSALADQTTALAQQNLDLKMDKAALQEQARKKEGEYEAVTKDLQQEVSEGHLRITRYKDMLTLDVADEILFDSADASLKKGADAVLRRVGKALSSGDTTIRVVGHTDDQPLAKGAGFATNWELSTARATTVVRFLQEQCGLDPQRLLAAGRGQWMPVASNSTAAGRQQNRRIQIMVLDKDLLNGAEGVQP